MKIVSTVRKFIAKIKPMKSATSELIQTSQVGDKTYEKLATNVADEASSKTSQVVQNPIYSTKPRPVTEADKVAAQQYFYALKNRTYITQDEIKELFAKDYNDFVVSAYKYLLKHSGITESLHPQLAYGRFGLSDAGYDDLKNVLYIDLGAIDKSKMKLFNLLNHELKHWMQNLDVLRTENLGDKAIKTYATFLKEKSMDAAFKVFKQLEQGKIENMTTEQIKMYKEFKKLYETDKSAFEKQFEDVYNLLIKEYSKFQKTAIGEMGVVKENSVLAKKSKMYFEDIKSAMSDDLENINYGLYFTRQSEKEAYLAGDMAETEVGGGCLFSKLKKQYEKIHADKDFSEQLRIGNEENQKRYAKALGE